MEVPPLKRSRSSSSFSEASDQISRERKSEPYRDSRYEILLGAKGSFLKDSKAGVLAADSEFCRTLLNFKVNPPSDTLFDDRFFGETMEKIQNENEARVVRDIGQLISPSAECLATRGVRGLHLLKESTNAGWNNCIPFQGTRPQPDFCVGFERNAFSNVQLKKLGFDLYAKTHFTATYKIYFPFFTDEVKCGQQGLDIADRQNAHSMTVAVRGIIEVFRLVGRAQELHRKVLGFSISHDHRTVRIYSHYAEIDGPGTTYYRHILGAYDILSEDGKDRWAAYQFVRNVYSSFAPMHLERIKSAVDQLPDPAPGSLPPTQSTEEAVSSQDMMVASPPSSQDVNFIKPATPRRQTVAGLRAQMELQRQKAEEEKEQLRLQQEELRLQLQAQAEQLQAEVEQLQAQVAASGSSTMSFTGPT
ncbi:MAG: hypothetical protein Q9207_008433 [Kuettlingeria erythrocarpa]